MDFLTDRPQQVVVDNEISDVAPVTSGVPQGSALGPFLFLTFINDMPECVTSQFCLFADGSIIYHTISGERDANALQTDLQALEKWEANWGMGFNQSKCNITNVSWKKNPWNLTYTLKDTLL